MVNKEHINGYQSKLDRSYRNLLQYKSRLESYLYEPTTRTLYETKEYLCHKIEQLVINHMEIMNRIRNASGFFEPDMTLVHTQLEESSRVKEDVEMYTEHFNQNIPST